MRYLGLLLSSFIILSCSSSKKTTEQEATVQVKSSAVKGIAVDGNDEDWKNISLTPNPNNTFEYALAHDDQQLYLLMKIVSPAEQRKFLTGGMELWIDLSGRKNKTTEVVFPVKGELAETALRPENTSTNQKTNLDMMHLNVRAALVTVNRIGFKQEYNGIQTASQNTGFKAAINWDENNVLIYELKIPQQAFTVPVKDNIDLEFSIGAIDQPENTSNNNGEHTSWQSNGGGMGGGRGGMRGGGGGRGGYGGGYGNRQGRGEGSNGQKTNANWKELTKKESFWVECKL